MKNWSKWLVTLALAFLGGVATAASDQGATPRDYARHGLIALAPAVAALKTKLEEQA